MKKKTLLKTAGLLVLSVYLFSSCEKDDDDNAPSTSSAKISEEEAVEAMHKSITEDNYAFSKEVSSSIEYAVMGPTLCSETYDTLFTAQNNSGAFQYNYSFDVEWTVYYQQDTVNGGIDKIMEYESVSNGSYDFLRIIRIPDGILVLGFPKNATDFLRNPGLRIS